MFAVSAAFVRACKNRPQRIMKTYYDNQAGLIARGIISQERLSAPNPFSTGLCSGALGQRFIINLPIRLNAVIAAMDGPDHG